MADTLPKILAYMRAEERTMQENSYKNVEMVGDKFVSERKRCEGEGGAVGDDLS